MSSSSSSSGSGNNSGGGGDAVEGYDEIKKGAGEEGERGEGRDEGGHCEDVAKWPLEEEDEEMVDCQIFAPSGTALRAAILAVEALTTVPKKGEVCLVRAINIVPGAGVNVKICKIGNREDMMTEKEEDEKEKEGDERKVDDHEPLPVSLSPAQTAFIHSVPGVQAWVPIGSLTHAFVDDISTVLKVGDEFLAECVGEGRRKGDLEFSRKALLPAPRGRAERGGGRRKNVRMKEGKGAKSRAGKERHTSDPKKTDRRGKRERTSFLPSGGRQGGGGGGGGGERRREGERRRKRRPKRVKSSSGTRKI